MCRVGADWPISDSSLPAYATGDDREHALKSVEARPFRAVSTLKPNRPGVLDSSTVRIFRGDEQIGGYERNFPSFSEVTFEPFELNGSWFALYSRDYTATRVMRLPQCEDLGGEEPASRGFCPVELFVPRFRNITTTHLPSGRVTEARCFEQAAEVTTPSPNYETSYGPWCSLDVGFVAGCIWGDDSSWKLEVFDLQRAAEGVISRSARFGHLELAHKMALAEAISLDSDPPYWDLRATIIREERRDVRTGALIDPYE